LVKNILKVMIVGGVAAGPKTAARLRRVDPNADITIIEKGDLISYAGCGMPFYIEDVVEDYSTLLKTVTGAVRDAEYFEKMKGVKVINYTEAVQINREKKTVTVRDVRGGDSRELPYDKLVLAIGASPIVPRMEGVELQGVYRLYNPHDAKAIKEAVDTGTKKVAVVGGGLIGLETCGAFVERRCKVTVLEMMPNLVPALLDIEMALYLEKYLKEKGVNLVTGSAVSRILDDGSGRVAGVETADGQRVDADMVIVAIGVRPNTELAAEAGLKIGPTRAIAVNERMQTSDPDIYAGGDCVECSHLVGGGKVYVPMGSTANKHGRIIANNIAGIEDTFPGVTATAVFKILGYNCGCTGLTEKKAKELGYDVVTSLCPKRDISHYIPGAKFFMIKLVAERGTGKLLGCQIVGEGDGVKRIDVAATVLKYGGTMKDLADLDLAYAPAYSTAIDGIADAANVMRNKMDDLAHSVNPVELKRMLDEGVDFVLVDCRDRPSYEAGTIETDCTLNVPLAELKSRYGELPRDKEIVFFCNTSIAAYNAERVMRGLGFTNVKFVEGSIKGWPYSLKP
jgi:NADPH-dependent 2,4-dienoyl-CoA reductase/sulfur reductase-like enzyme/rhodanese-related sulfurtransferase